MLRRIGELAERADRLCDDICERMPAQYRDHELVKGSFPDAEWDKRHWVLWEKDPVAASWAEAHRDAQRLPGSLMYLAGHIESRAMRNGVRLETPSTPAESTRSEAPSVQKS